MTQSTDLTVENNVLIGKERELYLAGGKHGILSYILGEWQINPASVVNWRRNLERRKLICDFFNIRYGHIVAPEKYNVHSENFPIENPRTMIDAYRDDNGRLPCFYPVDLLKKAEHRAYARNDTHFGLGGLLTTTRLIGEIAGRSPDEIDAICAEAMQYLVPMPGPFFGDLGNKVNPRDPEDNVMRIGDIPTTKTYENNLVHIYDKAVNEGRAIVLKSTSANARGSLLIFGDSYLHHTLPYLSLMFETVVYCRTQFFHDEMAVMMKPDVIISQAAERYLSFVYPDENAAPFLMTPYLLDRKPNYSIEEAEVFAEVLGGRRRIDFNLYARYRK